MGMAVESACPTCLTLRCRLRYTVCVTHSAHAGTGSCERTRKESGANGMQVIEGKRSQGASSEVVRDINRRIVLNLIRTRQPISRADLARASG